MNIEVVFSVWCVVMWSSHDLYRTTFFLRFRYRMPHPHTCSWTLWPLTPRLASQLKIWTPSAAARMVKSKWRHWRLDRGCWNEFLDSSEVSVFGKDNLLPPRNIRQHLYKLTPLSPLQTAGMVSLLCVCYGMMAVDVYWLLCRWTMCRLGRWISCGGQGLEREVGFRLDSSKPQ